MAADAAAPPDSSAVFDERGGVGRCVGRGLVASLLACLFYDTIVACSGVRCVQCTGKMTLTRHVLLFLRSSSQSDVKATC